MKNIKFKKKVRDYIIKHDAGTSCIVFYGSGIYDSAHIDPNGDVNIDVYTPKYLYDAIKDALDIVYSVKYDHKIGKFYRITDSIYLKDRNNLKLITDKRTINKLRRLVDSAK